MLVTAVATATADNIDCQFPQSWLKYKENDKVKRSLPTISNSLYKNIIGNFHSQNIGYQDIVNLLIGTPLYLQIWETFQGRNLLLI